MGIGSASLGFGRLHAASLLAAWQTRQSDNVAVQRINTTALNSLIEKATGSHWLGLDQGALQGTSSPCEYKGDKIK